MVLVTRDQRFAGHDSRYPSIDFNRPTIAAGYGHTVGLKSDGIVVAVGSNSDGQTNVSGWTGIRQPTYRSTYKAPDGEWWFNLRTADRSGNWTSTVHYGPFLIDTINTSGTIKINGGAAYAKSTGVTLNLTRPGGGSVQNKVRFKNDGGSWSDWQDYAASIGWTLTSANGAKKVWAQIRDMAGNISSAYSDTIVLDTVKPRAFVRQPPYSTKTSKTMPRPLPASPPTASNTR